jgi:hypothetical protein
MVRCCRENWTQYKHNITYKHICIYPPYNYWQEIGVSSVGGILHLLHVGSIDISWLDWAYKSSTCDVMYRRQRRHLYYGGHI